VRSLFFSMFLSVLRLIKSPGICANGTSALAMARHDNHRPAAEDASALRAARHAHPGPHTASLPGCRQAAKPGGARQHGNSPSPPPPSPRARQRERARALQAAEQQPLLPDTDGTVRTCGGMLAQHTPCGTSASAVVCCGASTDHSAMIAKSQEKK